jgi:hypothetical protein
VTRPRRRGPRAATALGGALLVLTAGSVAPGTAATAPFHACAGHYGFDGDPDGRFFRRIMARRTGCTTANRVTLAWVRLNAMHDGADPTGRVRVRGYSCRGRVVPDPGTRGTSGLAVRCSRDAKAITFFGHG